MLHLSYRPYDAERDLTALSEIWFSASLLAHPFLGEETLRGQRVLVETVYLPKAETLVAEFDGAPAGFISLLDDFIGGLFVAPNAQGKGLGRGLIAKALAPRESLDVEVYTQNRQAFGFYQALGFREIGRRSHDDQGLPFELARLTLQRTEFHFP